MKLDVNELEFDVCVPVRDVFGEPAKGRRSRRISGCRAASISEING